MGNKQIWSCDRCGFQMIEYHCKVVCPNCGARWDCSDVSIWVGDGQKAGEENATKQVRNKG